MKLACEVDRPGSKINKEESVEVTILETPPMVVVGVVGYRKGRRGLKRLTTVWSAHISEEGRRHFYKNWYESKKGFTKISKKWSDDEGKKSIDHDFNKIIKNCKVVRVLAHTQMKLKQHRKKSHILEIQINGGTVADKIAWAKEQLDKPIPIDTVFGQDEMIDCTGVTKEKGMKGKDMKGKGMKGVSSRWQTAKVPRKTVNNCAWPEGWVSSPVPRAPQNGYRQITLVNKQICLIGKHKDGKIISNNPLTNNVKPIAPIGGFPPYINNDFIMIRGNCMGSKKTAITLRKSLRVRTSRIACEKIILKSINPKSGHGRIQTPAVKVAFMGNLKDSIKEDKPSIKGSTSS